MTKQLSHIRMMCQLTLTALTVVVSLLATGMPVAAQNYTTVVVQRGDTLAKIASRNCADWQEIYNMNWQAIGPNPNTVEPGTVLTVINRCPDPQPPQPPSGVYDRGPRTYATGTYRNGAYYVAWGDTLTSVAQRFGLSVAAIMRANNLSNANLQAGQVLTITGAGPQPPQPPGAQRVRFNWGATSAQLDDSLWGGSKQYVLGASAGQWMQVSVTGNGSIPLTLATSDGRVLALTNAAARGYSNVAAQLPTTGDYLVTVGPVNGSTNYTIVFSIR